METKLESTSAKMSRNIEWKMASVWREYKKCKYLFLMLVPVLLWYCVFCYGPLYGIQLAFKDFRILDGITGSPWVGFKHFRYLFTASPDFLRIVKNTVIISFLQIGFGFPAPILLALLLNEIRFNKFKRIAQTISYMPHFLSWVILAGVLTMILSPSTGVVNEIIRLFGGESVFFLGDPQYFRFTLVISAIWKEVGWGTIIYLAALAGVDTHLYEAAVLDGANRLKQTIHITIPQIMPAIAILFILRIGNVMDAGFDQIINLYNPAVYSVADVIDTYVYRAGLLQMQFSLTTAVGLFKNVIALSLVLGTNYLIKRSGQEGLL